MATVVAVSNERQARELAPLRDDPEAMQDAMAEAFRPPAGTTPQRRSVAISEAGVGGGRVRARVPPLRCRGQA